MEKIDLSDIQGLIAGSYSTFNRSLYVLLNVTNANKAATWLASLVPTITHCNTYKDAKKNGMRGPEGPLMNIAFTSEGFRALGLHEDVLMQFSAEFISGMAPLASAGGKVSRRSGMLGDEGVNAPSLWNWGGWQKDKISEKTTSATFQETHILLAIFGHDDAELSVYLKQLMKLDDSNDIGVQVCVGENDEKQLIFKTYLNDSSKEHFGFRDGISQPSIIGIPVSKTKKKMTSTENHSNISENNSKAYESAKNERSKEIHEIALGEMVLGYNNERGQKYRVPILNISDGTAQSADFELGKNGSYMVVRQLKQDVPAFAKILEDGAEKIRSHEETSEGMRWVAARLMGRDYDGNPVTQTDSRYQLPPQPKQYYLDKHHVGAMAADTPEPPNDFKFHEGDENGLACPLTAHIRRAFPRDTLGPDPHTALKLSKRHRMLRRGRLYGEPVTEVDALGNYSPKNKSKSNVNRGLFFMAFNADIAGQFETIQHSWINNRHFAGRYNEIDPVTGQGETGIHGFAIQNRPFSYNLGKIPECISVRGGGYFFMPGLAALKQIIKVAENSK